MEITKDLKFLSEWQPNCWLHYLFYHLVITTTVLCHFSYYLTIRPFFLINNFYLRHQNIEVLPNGEAKFIGPSDANEEAGCVHSDVPIPNETEIR